MLNHRKSLEDAFQDIAVFMYGMQWWKNEEIKNRIYVEKHFLHFNNLKPVWQKMADNSKETGRVFTSSKSFNDIFQDVVSELHQFEFREGITLEENLCLVTSENLKTINN